MTKNPVYHKTHFVKLKQICLTVPNCCFYNNDVQKISELAHI
ncbi:hypothetical protein BAXH7_03242 [Bacillus amyloliquefaciens XH7]|nr:hypothetical protein BAXH7_03242 [Bacillus amyloliquefaciens XH7]QBG57628.1 hypothetical protein D2M30_3327 [Bacillus amyloliquefaciens]